MKLNMEQRAEAREMEEQMMNNPELLAHNTVGLLVIADLILERLEIEKAHTKDNFPNKAIIPDLKKAIDSFKVPF